MRYNNLVLPILGCIGLSVAPITAATRVVDTDGFATSTNCAAGVPAYTSITQALSFSNGGDKIVVCPGTGYTETLYIDKSITISGKAGEGVHVNSPALPYAGNTTSLSTGAPIAAHVLVDGVTAVTLENLIFDGSGSATNMTDCGGARLIGVYFRNASGTIKHSTVRHYRLGAGLGGCQTGLGIFVQADGIGGTANVLVQSNSVHDFQKNGITANEVGATMTAKTNVVTGDGPTSIIAQNNMQLGFGAVGAIDSNVLTNVVYTPASAASCNILVIDAGEPCSGVTVTNNTATNGQVGVYLDCETSTVSGNKISQTVDYDGIYVESNGSLIKSNTIFNAEEAGIWIGAGTGNSVQLNSITESPVGIQNAAGAGNTIIVTGSGKNSFFNVDTQTVGPLSLTGFVAGGQSVVLADAVSPIRD